MNRVSDKHHYTQTVQTMRLILLIVCSAAVMLALMVAQPAHADRSTPPDLPGILQVPAGNQLVRIGHAVGTQDYI